MGGWMLEKAYPLRLPLHGPSHPCSVPDPHHTARTSPPPALPSSSSCPNILTILAVVAVIDSANFGFVVIVLGVFVVGRTYACVR